MPPIIRSISEADNISIARLIRTVMPEFGAGGAGFAIQDPEVDDMHKAYDTLYSAYFVCEEDGKIIGAGGVAPLAGAAEEICELKKMYFLREGRGRGLGLKLLSKCLITAKEMGYGKCYIETFNTMMDAIKLYEKNGFHKIDGPLGNTGHFACDIFYLKEL